MTPDERRSATNREADRERDRRVHQLWQTIYGLPEEEGSGLVKAVNRLAAKVDRLTWTMAGTALTFAVGTISIILTGSLN